MSFRERVTKPRIITFLLLSLFPLGVIALSTSVLTNAYRFNVSVVLAFIVLPLILLAVLFLIVFSKEKLKWWIKGLLIYGTLIWLGTFFLILLVFGRLEHFEHYQNEDVAKHYTTTIAEHYEYEHMPTLLEVGDPEKTGLYVYACETIFYSEAHALMCQYDDAQYQSQKAAMEKTYVFQKDAIDRYGVKCEPTAQIDGYTFRMVSVEGEYGEELRYPNRMILIAANDETRELVYIAFYDADLDYIDSLSEFIMDDCGWKYIR